MSQQVMRADRSVHPQDPAADAQKHAPIDPPSAIVKRRAVRTTGTPALQVAWPPVLQYNRCKRQVSLTAGTLFARSHLPLRT